MTEGRQGLSAGQAAPCVPASGGKEGHLSLEKPRTEDRGGICKGSLQGRGGGGQGFPRHRAERPFQTKNIPRHEEGSWFRWSKSPSVESRVLCNAYEVIFSSRSQV